MKYFEWLEQNREDEIRRILQLSKEDYDFSHLFQISGEILKSFSNHLITLRSYLIGLPYFSHILPYNDFASFDQYATYLCIELNKQMEISSTPT